MKIKITALDLKALRAIKEFGWIGVGLDGEPWLESSKCVGAYRLRRLIEHKLLRSNQDWLPLGSITQRAPQSYSLSRRGKEVANA